MKKLFRDLMQLGFSAQSKLFIILSWFHMVAVTWPFYRSASSGLGLDYRLSAFHLFVWAIYSLIYLLPGISLLFLADSLVRRRRGPVAALAVVATSICLLYIRADSVIYDLYSFHFNGFVLNLLLTPGGMQSLGGGGDTYLLVALLVLGHVLVQVIAWFLSGWLARKAIYIPWRTVLAVLVVLMLGERFIYGVADVRNDGQILDVVKVYPFYSRTKFRTLAAKLGFQPAEREKQMAVEMANGRLHYPIVPIVFSPVVNPPNVVILAAESLRWDRLTEEIMPNTWRLAQKGQYFTHHYSSGNGTREGLFGLFYGLYGSYWSSFLYAQRPPLLMDRFQALDYQFDLRTSARFSYPEFDRTLFAGLPANLLHESSGKKTAWEEDREDTDALLDFLKKRDVKRPFMSFFFFESTHARYTFPDSAVIARPYLETVNYASMSRESLTPKIDQLLNRYTNAAHWVDVQMGRIYNALESQGLLENTIIIVIGDHGEEFMEKGAWGHNSSFVEEQIRTPLVMWMPGRGHQVITDVSSHLDIGTTLLQVLGAPKDAGGYSLGRNLFDIAARPFVVSSDWHSIAVITRDVKYRIPYTNRGADQWMPTDLRDIPYSKAAMPSVLAENNQWILEAIKNSSRFVATNIKRKP